MPYNNVVNVWHCVNVCLHLPVPYTLGGFSGLEVIMQSGKQTDIEDEIWCAGDTDGWCCSLMFPI